MNRPSADPIEAKMLDDLREYRKLDRPAFTLTHEEPCGNTGRVPATPTA